LGEWFVLKVVGVAVQEVEHEVHEDAVLSSTFDQPLEAGVTAVVEGDDLTHVMLEGGDCLGDGWESFGEVPMVPAIELDAGLVPFRDGPEPVPLNLKQPSRSNWVVMRRGTIGVIMSPLVGAPTILLI
jgi:hypothetical protein